MKPKIKISNSPIENSIIHCNDKYYNRFDWQIVIIIIIYPSKTNSEIWQLKFVDN